MSVRSQCACGAVAAATALLSYAAPALAVCAPPTLSGNTATVTCPPGPSGRVSVPDHVGAVTITAFGGSGGTTMLQPFSGAGGSAQATLNQAGAFELTVVVGAAGADASAGGTGGAPGGGDGSGGGGGGGYTSVTDASGTVLMTVGGGGGSGGSNGPFGAGGDGAGGNSSFYPDGRPGGACLSPPASACPVDFVDGGGATTTAPGAGDTHSVAGAIAGNPGQGNNGGDAGSGSGGGGGGAGCFGGGGGGTDKNGPTDGGGGGGGGSTCVDASLADVTNPASNGGDGAVTVTYTLPGGTKSVGGGFVDPGGASGPPVMMLANGGGVGVQLGCTGAKGTSCKGTVAASTRVRAHGPKSRIRTVKVGLAHYVIAANRVKVISVALNKRGRALLKRLHRLKVKVTVALSTSNGLKRAAVKAVTLKARRHR